MKSNQIKLSLIGLIVVLIFSYFSIRALFIPGFFPMHDDTQVVRVWQMAKALSDGLFPVRWVSDLGYGYGYPIFNFYAPFAYYFGALFTLIGFDVLFSTKLMMGVGFIFAGVSMYFLAKEFFGIKAAIISSLLYIYAPYHAVNLYVRGAVSEFWAYGFFPLFLLSLYKIFNQILTHSSNTNKQIFTRNYIIWSMLSALTFSLIIISHNLSAFILLLYLGSFLIIVCGIFKTKSKMLEIRYLIFPVLLGILLASFYWLPAILELNYTNISSQLDGNFDYNLHFIAPNQLWESQWGFGGSIEGDIDGMSFRIGKVHLLLSFIAIILLPFLWHTYFKQSRAIILLIIFFLLSVLFTTNLSKAIWDFVPVMKYIQFPWRFLSFVAFFSSLLGGAGVWGAIVVFQNKIPRSISFVTIGIIIFGVVLFYDGLFIPRTIYGYSANDFINEQNVKWTVSKISDEYMPKYFIKPINQSDIVKNKIVVLNGDFDELVVDKQTTKQFIFRTDSKTETDILIRTAPFPSWRLSINGKQTNYLSTNKGIELNINPGKNVVVMNFEPTTVQIIGNSLTLLSLALLIIGIIRYVSLVKKGSKLN